MLALCNAEMTMSSEWAFQFLFETCFQLFESPLTSMPPLHTLLEFTLTALCAQLGKKVYDQETEISILYSVALSGTEVSIGLEYSQTCSYNRLLTYLSSIFPERFYPGFHLFTFESLQTTQLHLNILMLTDWLLGKTLFYYSQRRSLWENLHSHGIIDQTGRWGLAYR